MWHVFLARLGSLVKSVSSFMPREERSVKISSSWTAFLIAWAHGVVKEAFLVVEETLRTLTIVDSKKPLATREQNRLYLAEYSQWDGLILIIKQCQNQR